MNVATDTVPVAVVIVTWNTREHVLACLDSLRALERPPAEIVVVDNASADGTVDAVASAYPEVVCIPNPDNAGFCRANNQGIAATSSPWVLTLNPDARLEPRFLEEALSAFDGARVGTVCGKLLRFDRRTIDSAGLRLARSRQPIDRGYGEPDRGQFEREEDVFGACGAAALHRRAMLADVAVADGEVFDERYFAFYEDLDLSWRARRRGWRTVYRPTAVGLHARGGTVTRRSRWARLAAMASRPPEIRYHIAKNRYLTIVRNDTAGAFFRDVPFILARDVAMVALLACTSPSVLVRLVRAWPMLRDTWRGRRVDGRRCAA